MVKKILFNVQCFTPTRYVVLTPSLVLRSTRPHFDRYDCYGFYTLDPHLPPPTLAMLRAQLKLPTLVSYDQPPLHQHDEHDPAPEKGVQRISKETGDSVRRWDYIQWRFLRVPDAWRDANDSRRYAKVGGDSKIPSVVCYDEDGEVVAVGSETDPEVNPELMEVENLVRAEWFKLHLRPPHLVAEQGFNVKDIPPLPPNKTVIDIFGDLLGYLYESTKKYIRERQGDAIFNSVGANIDFVLSHPNGWEGKQQSEMRHAAITARLVNDMSDALSRISFITEGEAGLHFCLNNVQTTLDEYVSVNRFATVYKAYSQANDGVLVLHCGGGTVDISAYARSSNGRFREIAPAECLLQGSCFVTRRAHDYLTEKLRESRYGEPEDINVMARYFDRTTKPSYKGTSKSCYIKFGRSENDPQFDIRTGSVKISGSKIADFFEPALKTIIQVIEEQSSTSLVPIKAIFMIGGFATSDYLFAKLDEHFNRKGINILRPDSHLNKAVAEGAISYKLDHSVSSRISRYTYGINCSLIYDSKKLEHVARGHTCFIEINGALHVPGHFMVILEKDTEVFEEKEFRKTLNQLYTRKQFIKLSMITTKIICYRGRRTKPPGWLDEAPDLFQALCIVNANLSEFKQLIKPRINRSSGHSYYTLEFEIIILFGLTELKAQVAWKENGVEKRGPASIIYDGTLTKDY